jgi:hypothetical protein
LRSAVHRHVHYVSQQLQTRLSREFWTEQYNCVSDAATATLTSKFGVLAQRLQHPGPPVHMTLNAMTNVGHRAAFSSFLCADWFFGKFAGNYFAKILLPRSPAHLRLTDDAGVTPSSVCLACWHFRRTAILEDEFHVVCVCPQYQRSRLQLSAHLPNSLTLNSRVDLCKLLSTSDAGILTAFGEYLVNVRQQRRKLKLNFERLDDRVRTKSFAVKRTAWRLKRRPSCRHGVLFSQLPIGGCKCMSAASSDEDWHYARFMPALDPETKCLTAVPFARHLFKRLAELQAQARSLGW